MATRYVEYKKKYGVLGITPREKAELVRTIRKIQGRDSCFGKSNGQCANTNCHLMHSCIGKSRQAGHVDLSDLGLPNLNPEQYEPAIYKETDLDIGVRDRVPGSMKFAWIGVGQCGGRLIKAFYRLGYKKALALDTAEQDLDSLRIRQEQKLLMDIGEEDAGKNMHKGRIAAEYHKQHILHLAGQTFGTQVNHIMVCFGAGGGTGGGAALGLINTARRYACHIGLSNPDKSVGVIMTLPTGGESTSPQVARNAYETAWQLSKMANQGRISPLVIIDNDKIKSLYPRTTVKSFYQRTNQAVATLFDVFNRLSAQSSQYTSFDSLDYRSIIQAGGCTIMGMGEVSKFEDRFAISEAATKNLGKTPLAGGFDLSTAKAAGCIVVGGEKLMAGVRGLQDGIDYAFDVFSATIGRAAIHRGIYEDEKDSLRVYTIIGGLNAPRHRLEKLRIYATATPK